MPVVLIPVNRFERAKGRLSERFSAAERAQLAIATFETVARAVHDAGLLSVALTPDPETVRALGLATEVIGEDACRDGGIAAGIQGLGALRIRGDHQPSGFIDPDQSDAVGQQDLVATQQRSDVVEVGGVHPPYGVIDVFLTAEQHRMGRLQNWVVENLPKDQGHTTVCLTQPVELLTFRPLMHSPTSRMLVRHAR